MRARAGVIVVGIMLTGCAAGEFGSRTAVGGFGGAAGGALLGATVSRGNPLAIAAGGVLGALAGAGIGSAMDAGAQQRQAQALREAMRTQRPVHWQGAEAAGSVIPRQVVMREGQACRMTTITTIIDGRVHSTDVCVRQGPGVGEFTVVQ